MSRAGALLSRWFPELCAFALGVALCTDRLVGVPGPESALLVGALAAPPLAAWAACRPAKPAAAALARAFARALTTLLAASLPLAVHALFVPFCGPRDALAFMIYGPGFGLPLAALLGTALRAHLSRPGVAVALALVFTLGSIISGLIEFWGSPGIVVFGEFGGYFPGTFYDTGVTFPESLLSYRLGSVFLAIALAAATALGDADRRVGLVALAIAALSVFAAFRANGERLGHVMTSARIEAALGGELVGAHCTLRFPRELARELAELHLGDCDREVRRLAALVGVSRPPRVTVHYYRSAAEKRALMGAGSIDLAKPWRREAHLVLDRFPHPVLTHELAHLIGAELATGPFGVPGDFFGLVPNAGLIEGFAVALAWDERMQLDPHQAARALLELERLPPVAEVTSLAFVRHPPAIAYAAAGSFLRFVMEERGAEALAEVYAAGSLAPLGEPLPRLEEKYRARLGRVRLPDGAVELAATRFSRPSVFFAACPHETASLRSELGGELASGDFEQAAATAEELLAIDDTDLGAHVERVRALAFTGRRAEALRAHEELVARGFPAPLLARSLTALGDERLLEGDVDGALSRYERALAQPQTEDAARALELRRFAIERGGELPSLARELFLGRSGRPPDAVVVMDLARRIGEAGEPSLGAYLAARQLAAREDHRAALARLDEVTRLPSARFEREAARLRLRSLMALGRHEEARSLARELAREPSTAHEGRAALERLR